MTARIGSVFSGGGGLDLAVESVFGGHPVWHSELDPAASKVLAHRWPGVPNHGDITRIDWGTVEPVEILCGGFPCQDVSSAGRRAGLGDGTRTGLWTQMAGAIAALRPAYVIAENIRGLLSATAHRPVESATNGVGDDDAQPVLRAVGAVLGDLADLGYDAQWATVSAASVGAPHRRERVFILATPAYPDDGTEHRERSCAQSWRGDPTAADSCGHRCGGNAQRNGQPLGPRLETPQRRNPDGRGDIVADSSGDGRHEGRPESEGFVGGFDAALGGAGPVDLLPTPCAHQSGNTPENHLAKKPGRKVVTDLAILVENGLLETAGALLPTPNASDGTGGGQHPARREGHSRQLIDYALLHNTTRWGKYGPAIARWEQLTRPAPSPTEPNTRGNPRLNPAFSEWLMGWPDGWVTNVPGINGWVTNVPGISRNDQLRIVGNGVCPQQAIAALRWLRTVSEMAA